MFSNELKELSAKVGIDDRVEVVAKKQCYITIKDHKENFQNNTKVRLINPAKSQVGIISKQLLESINSQVREAEGLQQWRNTAETLNWFKEIKNKKFQQFIQLDIQEFYPSITEKIFDDAIEYASSVCPISKETIDTIKNACKSLLFSEGETWVKTNNLYEDQQ